MDGHKSLAVCSASKRSLATPSPMFKQFRSASSLIRCAARANAATTKTCVKVGSVKSAIRAFSASPDKVKALVNEVSRRQNESAAVFVPWFYNNMPVLPQLV